MFDNGFGITKESIHCTDKLLITKIERMLYQIAIVCVDTQIYIDFHALFSFFYQLMICIFVG